MTLEARVRELYKKGELDIPAPGSGLTPARHRRLAEWARLDLSLARLAEAHVDALAILAEAGCKPGEGLYGVWAAETPGRGLDLGSNDRGFILTGTKMFCSGAGLIDRALITVEGRLMDVDLRRSANTLAVDESGWKSSAFAETNTATVHFLDTPVTAVVGAENWYLKRPGFWHGACGPAACWAGGAMGLLDYALEQARDEPHALAHLGAMSANAWVIESILDSAGREIDDHPLDYESAKIRALQVRHLIEQASNDMLHRLGRAFGPRPLAFDPVVSRRYQELELYIRQSHAERDLELLGRSLFQKRFVEVLPGISARKQTELLAVQC